MPAADAPAFAPTSDRMCTTAMAAAKGMLPSHDDSAMLQWRREAVQHRMNGYLDNHMRVMQAKEQAVQNMEKLQQHQVHMLLQSVQRLVTAHVDMQTPMLFGTSLTCLSCSVVHSSTLAGFPTSRGVTNSRPPAVSLKGACAVIAST